MSETYVVTADCSESAFNALPSLGELWPGRLVKATTYKAKPAPRTFWQWLTRKPGNRWIVDVTFESVNEDDRPPNVLEQTKAFAKREQR